MGLLVGLLILTIVGFIPYLGGLVRFGVLCLGLGAFAGQLYRASRAVIGLKRPAESQLVKCLVSSVRDRRKSIIREPSVVEFRGGSCDGDFANSSYTRVGVRPNVLE